MRRNQYTTPSERATRVTEVNDWEVSNANSGEIYAKFEDGVSIGYCPDARNDGPVSAIDPEGNTQGVWVCHTCGEISDYAAADSRGSFALGQPTPDLQLDQWVVVRARGFVDDVSGRVSFVESPYEAKESIKSLPRESERQWLPSWNKWVVWTPYEEGLLDQVRSDGWNALSIPKIVEEGDE